MLKSLFTVRYFLANDRILTLTLLVKYGIFKFSARKVEQQTLAHTHPDKN